jgi:hypothetical protein
LREREKKNAPYNIFAGSNMSETDRALGDQAAGDALRAALAAYDNAEAQQANQTNLILEALREPGQTITTPKRAADALTHAIEEMARDGKPDNLTLRGLLYQTQKAAENVGLPSDPNKLVEEDPFLKWRREQSNTSLRNYAEQYGLDPNIATWKDVADAQQRLNRTPRVEMGIFSPDDISGMNQFLVDFYSDED